MRQRWIYLVCALLIATTGKANESPGNDAPEILAIELPEDMGSIGRGSDSNEPLSSSTPQDIHLESYIQGVLDAKFQKYAVVATVRNGHIILSHLPPDTVKANKIITYVKKMTSVSHITVGGDSATLGELPKDPQTGEDRLLTKHDYTGIWLPQSTILFPSQIANPRQICFSVGHRMGDTVCGGHNGSAVTFGDQFPMYRWTNVWQWKGDLQLELEAGVFAVFNQDHSSSRLQNADYYAGIPLSYAVGPWAFRARLYHISSHLGDEYMHHHRHICRKNRSFEAIDFFSSYQITSGIRVYGGPGVVIHSDSQMRVKPLYAEYGSEVRAFRHNFTQLFGQPFLAMHFRNYQDTNFDMDVTYALGYEWGKIQGVGRKIRLFMEYHDGFSSEGQFSHKKTNFFGLRLSYGF